MTVNDAIKRALRLLGVLDGANDPESFELDNALVALNSFLASLSAQKNAIYAPVTTSFSTVAGTATYTIGTGGDINVTRPKNIEVAWIRESDDTDYELEIIAMENYTAITDKTITSRPTQLYHERKYPLGDVTLFYEPDAIYTVYLKLWAAFTVYTTFTESLALPGEYEEMVCSNLAIRLAPEYQRPVSQELAFMAKDSLETIKNLNAQPIPQLISDPFRVPKSTSIYDG